MFLNFPTLCLQVIPCNNHNLSYIQPIYAQLTMNLLLQLIYFNIYVIKLVLYPTLRHYSTKSFNCNSYMYVHFPLHLIRLMNLQVHNHYYVPLISRYKLLTNHLMMILKLKVLSTFNKCSQLFNHLNSYQVLYNLMLLNYLQNTWALAQEERQLQTVIPSINLVIMTI
jgi:hypothetical protein